MTSGGPTTELTAELITTACYPSSPALSPDGRSVAWQARPYGRDGDHPDSGIWVAPVDGSTPARRWTQGATDTDPRWSPDGTSLAFLSDRAERGVAGLYLLAIAGGEAAPVAVRKAAVTAFCWSPDSSTLAFLAPDEPDEEVTKRRAERDDPDVFGELVPTCRLFTVPAGGGGITERWKDDRHATALAWSPDGTTIGLLTQPTPELDLAHDTRVGLVAVDSGEFTDVAGLALAEGLLWSGSGELVAAAPHERSPLSSATIWSIPATPGGKPVVLGPGPDEQSCAVAVRVVAGGPAPAAVLVHDRLSSRIEWRAADRPPRTIFATDGEIADLDVWGTGDGVATADGAATRAGATADDEVGTGGDEAIGDGVATADGPVLALVMSDDGQPPEVWAGRPGELRRLSDHHAGWADVTFGAVEPFPYRAADGLDLDAVLVRPVGNTPQPWPTVVLPHGGPYGRDGLGLHCHPLDWAQWLATAGYAVLLPNYRGSQGRGSAFASTVIGDMGGAEWGDVLAVVDAAVEQGIADPERLGIGGWSQGGFLTAWGVTQTDRFRAAVMGAGVSDWHQIAATGDEPTFEAGLAGGLPWDGDRSSLPLDRSPITHAKNVVTPLLILHGERDERVPLSQGTSFHRALRGRNLPLALVVYPREPHGIRERRHQEDILRRVRDWFAPLLLPAEDPPHRGSAH